jgi:TetR/AcrR family transcriptional regulator, transcriptional repressor of aconitase
MPRVSASYLAERRAHVLDAAARCFAREGFHRTTMQHVVREAGLSPGAIYRYFASKEDIVAAIAAERHAVERDLLREAAAGDGIASLARAFLGRLGQPREREWRRVTVQLWGEALRNDRVLRVVRSGLDEPLRRLTAMLRAGQRKGTVAKDLDAPATARVCAAVFEGLVLQQAWEPRLDVARFVAAAERLLATLAPGPTVRRRLGKPGHRARRAQE